MKLQKLFICFIFIILSSGSILGVPAYPLLIKKVQPNGDTIHIRMKGDEKIKWMESEDGYSLLFNEDKYIVYAVQNEFGNMIPSTIIAKDISLRSNKTKDLLIEIPKKLQYSNQQKEIFRQLSSIHEEAQLRSDKSPQATTGKAKAICALIEFRDKSFYFSRNDFDQLMNQIGYVNGIQRGSVRDYYFENSYGQLDLQVTVVGPFRAKNNYSYYGKNRNQYDIKPYELAKEAADYAFSAANIKPTIYPYVPANIPATAGPTVPPITSPRNRQTEYPIVTKCGGTESPTITYVPSDIPHAPFNWPAAYNTSGNAESILLRNRTNTIGAMIIPQPQIR